jgi:hypothetical protein
MKQPETGEFRGHRFDRAMYEKNRQLRDQFAADFVLFIFGVVSLASFYI